MSNMYQCEVCHKENDIQRLLRPCTHRICEDCSSSIEVVNVCPICSETVTDFRTLHLYDGDIPRWQSRIKILLFVICMIVLIPVEVSTGLVRAGLSPLFSVLLSILMEILCISSMILTTPIKCICRLITEVVISELYNLIGSLFQNLLAICRCLFNFLISFYVELKVCLQENSWYFLLFQTILIGLMILLQMSLTRVEVLREVRQMPWANRIERLCKDDIKRKYRLLQNWFKTDVRKLYLHAIEVFSGNNKRSIRYFRKQE